MWGIRLAFCDSWRKILHLHHCDLSSTLIANLGHSRAKIRSCSSYAADETQNCSVTPVRGEPADVPFISCMFGSNLQDCAELQTRSLGCFTNLRAEEYIPGGSLPSVNHLACTVSFTYFSVLYFFSFFLICLSFSGCFLPAHVSSFYFFLIRVLVLPSFLTSHKLSFVHSLFSYMFFLMFFFLFFPSVFIFSFLLVFSLASSFRCPYSIIFFLSSSSLFFVSLYIWIISFFVYFFPQAFLSFPFYLLSFLLSFFIFTRSLPCCFFLLSFCSENFSCSIRLKFSFTPTDGCSKWIKKDCLK